MIVAKCDLSIELERAGRRYQPGERITGLVRVSVDAETKCDALTLTRQWRTHGKGNQASGPEDAQPLFTGVWQPGTYTYPFDLPCPDSPMSYHGQLLHVDWYLDARADVPWAIDPKASTDVFVEPSPEAEVDIAVTSAPAQGPAVMIIALLFMIPFALAGFVVLGVGLSTGEPFMLLFALGWFLVIGLFIWMIVKRRLARSAFKRLGTALERIDPGRVAVNVDYDSAKLVKTVVTKLIVEEVVVRGSGTDKTTYRETVHQSGQVVQIDKTGPHSFRVEFDLPDPRVVGWSFSASDNDLSWYVSMAFDIDSWPDLDERMKLTVRPRLGPAAGPYRGAGDYGNRWGPS